MLNPNATPFYPGLSFYSVPCNVEKQTIDDNDDTRTCYEHIIHKVCYLRMMFPGSEISDLISSYLFYDFKGYIEKRRLKSISGEPSHFHIGLINNVIKNCRYINDERGRYLFNSATVYQYFEVVEEDKDNQSLELKTSMKSVWIGPVRFCLKSGDYSEWCKCSLCEESAKYVIVFSDSDEEADIIF
jgi:hypothetical protein